MLSLYPQNTNGHTTGPFSRHKVNSAKVLTLVHMISKSPCPCTSTPTPLPSVVSHLPLGCQSDAHWGCKSRTGFHCQRILGNCGGGSLPHTFGILKASPVIG